MYRIPDNLDEHLKDLLFEPSSDAQDIRRNLLHSASILLVGGGPTRNLFLYKRIKQLGASVYIVDAPSSIWADPALSFLLSGFIPFDFSETPLFAPSAPSAGGASSSSSAAAADPFADACATLSNRFIDACNAHTPALPRFDAVLTFDDAHLLAAPVVAAALRVPFQSPNSLRLATDKHLMRDALQKHASDAASGKSTDANYYCSAGPIATPQSRIVTCEDDVLVAVAELGLPVVVKPAAGAHSAGVQFAADPDAAVSAFWYARDLMRPDDELLWRLCASDAVVIEQFVPGVELDVLVLLSGGEPVYAKPLDRWHASPPWFEQHGFDSPSRLFDPANPAATCSLSEQDVVDYAVRCLHAMEFAHGVFHVELRIPYALTSDAALQQHLSSTSGAAGSSSSASSGSSSSSSSAAGSSSNNNFYTDNSNLSAGMKQSPMLIEINPRIGSGPVYFLHRVTWGVDLVEELCYVAMGLPSRPVVARSPRRFCLASFFPTPRSGLVNRDGWLEWARDFDDRVVTLVEFFRDGEEVLGKADGIPDNLGHVMVAAAKRQECYSVLRQIFERIEVPVEGEEGETGGKFTLMAPEE